MPVNIGTISLWPIHEPLRERISQALERAAQTCRAGEAWRVSVYEGPEIEDGQMELSARGTQPKAALWGNWEGGEEAGEYRYFTRFHQLGMGGEGSWIEEILERRLREFLSLPRADPQHNRELL